MRIILFWTRPWLNLNKAWIPSSPYSLEIPELDTSLDEPDAITTSVSSVFLHLVSTFSDNSKLQLAASIRSHKLWCQARALLAPVSLATMMLASKLIHYFCSYSVAFRSWSSTPPDNITLTSANRKAYQFLSDFQTGVGGAAYASLDTEQLNYHLRVALVDTLSLWLILREALSLCLKCVIYFSRFVTFWTMLFPNELGTQLVF